MKMSLQEAIVILRLKLESAESELSNGSGDSETQEYVDALKLVFDFIYDVLQISKIGKK